MKNHEFTTQEPIYLDIETTGLDPAVNEILEIAIVNQSGKVLMNTLVRPVKCLAWDEAQAINGITPAMVEHAPTLKNLHARLKKILHTRVVRAWNAPFDFSFIPKSVLGHKLLISCDMANFGEFITTTQPLNKSQSGRYKMQDVAKELGINQDGDPHRALSDVKTMMAIRSKYMDQSFNRTDLNGFINTPAYTPPKFKKPPCRCICGTCKKRKQEY